MKICLKKLLKDDQIHKINVNLSERLPQYCSDKCLLSCEYKVEQGNNCYLLSLKVKGDIAVICQRCNEVFHYDYNNESVLAICDDDTIANSLMSDFDCIVEKSGFVDLIDILTDEMYLFIPQKHANKDCDKQMLMNI